MGIRLGQIGRKVGVAASIAAAGLLVGCQGGAGGLGGAGASADADLATVTAEELRGYCPEVELRAGTAFFNSYDGAAGRDNLRYQASITDVSRQCAYEGDQLRMTVAVAGKVVLGAKGSPGTIRLPVRVAALRGEEVLYSQIRPYEVQVSSGAATQFLYRDEQVVFARPQSPNIDIFAGFDAGPNPGSERVAAAGDL